MVKQKWRSSRKFKPGLKQQIIPHAKQIFPMGMILTLLLVQVVLALVMLVCMKLATGQS